MGQRREQLLQRAVILPELRARAAHHPVATKAQGVRIYDVDNIGYIDYIGAGGAAIVGYGNQFVLDAVRKVLLTGVPSGLHVPQELELAESLLQFVPWAGSWWFCRNSDDAFRALFQWVRRTTGKDRFLTLDGGARFSAAPLFPTEDGDGGAIHEVPGWDVEEIEDRLISGGSQIGALVVDPLMTRFGVIPPPPGALERIAAACRERGVLLVFDERVTGFRVHRGGAGAWSGVAPDLAVFGGALGGGFAIGGVAFARDLEPCDVGADGPLPAPHPLSLAAAEAVLSILKNDSIYRRLEERTAHLVNGVLSLAESFSVPLTVNRVGSVFALYLTDGPVVDRRSVARADAAGYRRLAADLLAESVLLPQDSTGSAFVSNAHGAKDVEETLAACERVLPRLQGEEPA